MIRKKKEKPQKHTKHKSWMDEVNAELIMEVMWHSYLPIKMIHHVWQVLYFLNWLLIFLSGVNDDKN